MTPRLLIALVLCAALAGAASAQTPYIETFDTDNAGWHSSRIRDNGTTTDTDPTFEAADGAPNAGCIYGLLSTSQPRLYTLDCATDTTPYGDMTGLCLTVDSKLDGTVTGPVNHRVRFYIGTFSGGKYNYWVTKDELSWDPNGDTDWTTHEVALVEENFVEWPNQPAHTKTFAEVVAACEDMGLVFADGFTSSRTLGFSGTGRILIDNFGTVAPATRFTLRPGDLADGPEFANGYGGEPFGYDPDMPRPEPVRLDGPAGYGTSCWWSNVQGSAAGGPRDYTALRLSPHDIFGQPSMTIAELAEIAYWTKNLNTDLRDWQLKIYTRSDVKWYGHRFNFTLPEATDNLWHRYETDTHLTVSDVFDKVANQYVAVPGSGRLSDLVAAGYGDEEILFIDIIAGFATNSPPVDSLLDGIEIALASGERAQIDLISAATLTLNVPTAPDTLYVQPGETFDVTLDVSDLQVEVKACQAIIGYDSAYLTCSDVFIPDPMTNPWNDLIWGAFSTPDVAPGEVDTAVGVYGESQPGDGTTADGTIVAMEFVADATPGLTAETMVTFRYDVDDVESTFLADMNAEAVWPSKLDSQIIKIDGVAPEIEITSATQGSRDCFPGSDDAVRGTVTITVDARDLYTDLSGPPQVTVTPNGGTAGAATLVGTSGDTFTYEWTVQATTPNGLASIEAVVEDLAGNTAGDAAQFNVNKNRITGQVELQGFVGTGTVPAHTREVTFVATGAATATWTVALSNAPTGGAVFDFTLDDVPDGVTHLSAKTAWNLRSKVALSGGTDNQWGADLTGADMLPAGDLNDSNTINVLDYTLLKQKWFSTYAGSDLNGDGQVQTTDYTLMKLNWYTAGDDQ